MNKGLGSHLRFLAVVSVHGWALLCTIINQYQHTLLLIQVAKWLVTTVHWWSSFFLFHTQWNVVQLLYIAYSYNCIHYIIMVSTLSNVSWTCMTVLWLPVSLHSMYTLYILLWSMIIIVVTYVNNCGFRRFKLIHEWIKRKAHKLEWWKSKISNNE